MIKAFPIFTVLATLMIGGCATSATPGSPAGVMQPNKLSAGAWYVEGLAGAASQENRGFMSNAGFVVTSDGVVVFDALATPSLAQSMLDAIRALTTQPVRYVIVSHYHADHFYGLQVFKEAGAQIWACSEGLDYLRSDMAQQRLHQRRDELAPWVNRNTQLIAADRWLDCSQQQVMRFDLGDQSFDLLSGNNAHSPGDLMLSARDQGVLFAGDLYFSGRLPSVVDGNTRQWLAALDRIESSGARIVVPGHGPASTGVDQDLDITRGYLRFLRARMAQAAADLEDFDQAYAETNWSAFEHLPTFALANRRNAYSVYLEMQAELLNPPTAATPAKDGHPH